MQLTKNFGIHEFVCRDGSMPEGELESNVRELAENLQVLRDYIGKPIRIISGYRSPSYNTKIGGAKGSQHMKARASDIKNKGVEPREIHGIIEGLIAEGKMKQGGLGLYPTFVHYDTRGHRARWNG